MTKRSLLISNLVFCIVILLLIIYPKLAHLENVKVIRDYSDEYKFTNPILDYEDSNMEQFSIISATVDHKVMELEGKYGLDFASVYYRDLDNGEWIGVHEKTQFVTASLIKLPILISLFKESETDPTILDKQITITEDDANTGIEQNIKPEDPVKVGQSYTLRALGEKMAEESDNIAMRAVLRNIDPQYRKEVFQAVGVAFQEENDEVMIRVKDYAGFFRVLFNASYLSRADSEAVLGILAKVKFTSGIIAGVPPNILVAHKFGERSNYINGLLANRQLHDCGIVYYPDKPYLLCIMTRGNDYDAQSAFIRDISEFFYKEVSKSMGKN